MSNSTSDPLCNYRTVRLLGKGGMGVVREVEDPDGRHFALKDFIATGPYADFLRKRFIAEGRILAQLDHPRLVKVHDIGIDDKGRPWFTMDLVRSPDGFTETLEDLRQAHRLDERLIAEIYADLAEGITYLHENGIIHRDIKAQNVLIDSSGHAVISDFGIARIFDPDLRHALSVTTTMTGDDAPIMGSYGYFAPELKRGEPATPASDAYALGSLLFRLLTGVWYEADSTALDLLAEFDPAWRGLLTRLLNEDPAMRLPIPPQIKLGTAHQRKLFCRLAFAVLALLLVAVATGIYICRRPPQYSFDEFFPASEPSHPSHPSQPFSP